jgi:hypothetical protein
VAQTGMQREGGYRSPPLARANEDTVDTPGTEPVPAE